MLVARCLPSVDRCVLLFGVACVSFLVSRFVLPVLFIVPCVLSLVYFLLVVGCCLLFVVCCCVLCVVVVLFDA